jgi:hypothetical protein
LVRKAVSFSKELERLEAARLRSRLDQDLTHVVKTLQIEVKDGPRPWVPSSPAMAVGLRDRIWTVKDLLMAAVAANGTMRISEARKGLNPSKGVTASQGWRRVPHGSR